MRMREAKSKLKKLAGKKKYHTVTKIMREYSDGSEETIYLIYVEGGIHCEGKTFEEAFAAREKGLAHPVKTIAAQMP